jgi:formamidopyrimidine-DNA glycosylase
VPELPEVEVVRRGLDDHVVGSVLHRVEVLHPRAARRHELGSLDLEARLAGTEVRAVDRRGKYLWLVVAPPGGDLARAEAIVVHLGMSGQMLVQPTSAPAEKHLRIRVDLGDDRELRFVDQRTTSRAIRWIRCSTSSRWWRRCAASTPRSNVPCSTRPSSRASATSTPTSRCGAARSTVPV